jgi:hypothetical protein
MPFVGDAGLERAAAQAVAAHAQAERDRDAGRVSDNDVWQARERAVAANAAAYAARIRYGASPSGWLPRPAQATHLMTTKENPNVTTMSAMSFRTTGAGAGGFQTQASGFAGPAGLNAVPETARDLRAQAGAADALAEQLQLLMGVVNDWRTRLGDRLAGAGWGTEQITVAAETVDGAGEDLTALQDGLASLLQACQDAITVGAEAAAKAATGAAESFQAR